MTIHISYFILGAFFAILIGIAIYDCVRRRCPISGIIAGDVNLPEENLPIKHLFSFNNFKINGKRVDPKKCKFVGYLKGKSLTPFGLLDGKKVFCEEAKPENIKRGDVLILETFEGPNRGKPKGRKCLGLWGNGNQPDDDLKKIEGHCGSVTEYFTEVSPKKYGHKSYSGPIDGFLKTLSCDRDGETLKISRPHDPTAVIGRVEYVL